MFEENASSIAVGVEHNTRVRTARGLGKCIPTAAETVDSPSDRQLASSITVLAKLRQEASSAYRWKEERRPTSLLLSQNSPYEPIPASVVWSQAKDAQTCMGLRPTPQHENERCLQRVEHTNHVDEPYWYRESEHKLTGEFPARRIVAFEHTEQSRDADAPACIPRTLA
jgi:hypothetical protein